MKNILHHNFTPSGRFTGTLLPPVAGVESTVLTGDKSQPGNALKLAAGTDAWVQDVQTVVRGGLILRTLTENDWTDAQRFTWVAALCQHITSNPQPSEEALLEMVAYFEDENVFQLLSGVSLSYFETEVVSGEIAIGVNVYPFNLEPLMQVGSDEIRVWLAINYPNDPILVSHLFHVSYLQHSEIVWCFGGQRHQYSVTGTHDLATGGGSYFGEVKLAGNGQKASYTIKKNVDPLDPTGGLYSGVKTSLNVGDKLHLLDTSVHTTLENGVWTWVGDYTQIPFVWYVAEITYPYEDYKNFPLNHMFIPIEVLEYVALDNEYNLANNVLRAYDFRGLYGPHSGSTIVSRHNDPLRVYNGEWNESGYKGGMHSASYASLYDGSTNYEYSVFFPVETRVSFIVIVDGASASVTDSGYFEVEVDGVTKGQGDSFPTTTEPLGFIRTALIIIVPAGLHTIKFKKLNSRSIYVQDMIMLGIERL